MPRRMEVPDFANPRGGTKHYKRFRGLDYLGDETQIDDGRSPRAINMIADEGGFPERRYGWRTICTFAAEAAEDDAEESQQAAEAAAGTSADGESGAEQPTEPEETDPEPIAGIFAFENDEDEENRTFLIHAGSTLYKVKLDADYALVEDSKESLLSDLHTGGRSQGFYMNGKLYIMTGAEYIVYDGEEAARVTDDTAYAPLTSYQRQPTGGGEAYEAVNMLCKWRRNRFVADGSAKTFQLDVTEIDANTTPTASYFITGDSIPVQSYDAAKGTVTFASAPSAPENAGTSNIEIKFAKTTEDREKVLGCTIFAIYGLDGSGNRVFVSGNSEHGATEWFSGLSDPTYFPDINYSVVGSDDFPIVCYLKAQGELLIVKKDNRQEGTIWHHAGALVNDVATFPLKEGIPGYGAIAKYSAANLNDDPLYLSPRGVYAPTTTYYNNMQVRQLFCRSRRINPKLCKENGLADAVSAVWRGWYVLVLPNGNAYVADGNQERSENGYEWYYWTNIPAHVLCAHEQTLYFGTADGRLCKFNDDFVTGENEVLMKAYNDDGAPIHAEWATRLDTMDTPMELKTMPKRGSGVHLKAYTRSTVEIWIRTEQDHGEMKKKIYADRLDFNDINFVRFTFSTAVNGMIPFVFKKKKWKAIQVLLISDALNEGFGVHAVVIRYFINKYAKR